MQTNNEFLSTDPQNIFYLCKKKKIITFNTNVFCFEDAEAAKKHLYYINDNMLNVPVEEVANVSDK